jgi:hypothetical protein
LEARSTYLFAVASVTLAVVVLEALCYATSMLHPAFAIVANLVLCLCWIGGLAAFFFWGGGVYFTGPRWVSEYHALCITKTISFADSVTWMRDVTCAGERILLDALPFIGLNMCVTLSIPTPGPPPTAHPAADWT